MNKILLFFFLISLFACNKDSLPKLIGRWELKKSINGFTGAVTNHPPNNGTVLEFSAYTYKRFSAGTLAKSGVYKTVKDRSSLTGETGNRIIYDNETDLVRFFYILENGLLSIGVDAVDGPVVVYERENSH